MADAIRLHAEFTDDLGTAYKLNIHQNGFVGSSTEFNLGADGFTLRYSGNNEDRMQPIIGSEVTFTLIENVAAHTTFLTALATSEDAAFTVSIFKDPDGANTLFWTGVLLHEQVELQDEAFPIQNTMTAVDDLGNLKNIPYDNSGTFYTGQETIAAHLTNLLNKTRALHIFASGDVFLKYANDFKPTTFSSANALIELQVGHAAFYNLDEDGNAQGMDCFTVLKNFAITFNARVFLHEGCFYFMPVGAVINNTTVNLFTVTKAGTISGSATATDTQLTVDTDMERMRGGVTTFLPALNKVQRTWRTDANLPVVGPETQFLNAINNQIALGTNITDNNLLYDNGTVFRMRFRYNHSFDGDGTSTGDDVPARIILKMQIKVGSLYYNNAVTFGPNTMNVGYASDAYTIDTMTFSAPAWSSSAGHFFFAVTPTPAYIDRNDGLVYNMTFTPQGFVSIAQYNQPVLIDLAALTSAQTGITITVNVQGYDHDGNLITDVTGTNAYGKLEKFGMHIVNGNASNGDRVVYEAVTTANNQETLIQDEVVIGSSAFEDYRNIYENNSSPAQPIDSFASFANSSATVTIHKLGVQEVIAGQNASTRVKRGSFYKAFVSPFHALLFSTRNFLPFETTFMARAVQTEYEAFHINTDDTNVSTPAPEVINDNEPIDDSEPVYDLQNTFTPDDGDIPPNIFQRFLQQPVTTIDTQNGRSTALTDVQQMVIVNYVGGAGTATIQLPAVANFDGAVINVAGNNTISASNIISIVPASGDTSATINGAANYNLNSAFAPAQLLCSGGNWFVLNSAAAGGGSGLSDIVNDTSPQLGGDLDVNGNGIISTGDIIVQVDSDSNTSDSAFSVRNGAGTVLFAVNESGITSGLLTTATPTLSGVASSYAQSASVTGITVSNHVSGRTYDAAIFNSSGTEQTSNPVSVDTSGNITFTSPSTVATGYELRITGSDPGKLTSIQTTATFEVTASRTFEVWRVQGVDSSGNASSNKAAFVELTFHTGANATGVEHPTSDASSSTSITNVVISSGHQHSETYANWRAFDGTTHGTAAAGSMWWTLGNSDASLVWIQARFSTAQTFESLRLTVYNSFNDATHIIVKGSNTGSFSGEEVSFGLTAITETGSAGITTVNF